MLPKINSCSVIVFMGFIFLSLTACEQKNEASQTTSSSSRNTVSIVEDKFFKPSATLQELMLAVIDPNVDPIWNSISTVSSAEGVVEVRPQTDEEWNTLRNHAVVLREVSNLLVVKGRKVAVEGAATSIHHSELHPEPIEALITANWLDFVKHAHHLHDAADLAIKAIDEKNVDRLEEVGGLIEHACEGCHSQFWYPGDKRPVN
jgi:hypothetical protein